jgi:hypothetical protein
MGTSPYSNGGYISPKAAPYNGCRTTFVGVRTGKTRAPCAAATRRLGNTSNALIGIQLNHSADHAEVSMWPPVFGGSLSPGSA